MKFHTINGMRDVAPPETILWNRVESAARDIFARYAFAEIRTPLLEPARLFERSIGGETDVVTKELYGWVDSPKALKAIRKLRAEMKQTESKPSAKDSKSRSKLLELADSGAFDSLPEQNRVALRPEATASICRAYIEHGMQTLPGNVKLYCIGPMFRRERPQKGRYRQFYQIDAEVLGQSDAPAIDAELIEMLLVFFERVGLKGTTLSINSIGDKNCRPKYVELLRETLRKEKDKLGADSQRRIDTNPLRVLDSKLPEEQAVIEKMPRIADHLCDECRAHFEKLQSELKLREISYDINWRLVRGLDYYMRTTFEIVAPGLGSQNAVCGGGRYDGLVELLGGPAVKGIGFAIGTDRLILSLQEAAKDAKPANSLDVFVAWMGEKSYAPAVQIARQLRDAGITVELPPEEMKFKKSIGLADKLGAKYALIIGEDEVASGQYSLKNLADGSQAKYSGEELLGLLAPRS